MRANTRKMTAAADDYLELVRQFPLRPIRTLSDNDRATAILINMAGRGDLSAGESDYIEMLSRMVADYDQKNSSPLKTPKSTPIEILKFLMEQHDMNTISLGRLVGGS